MEGKGIHIKDGRTGMDSRISGKGLREYTYVYMIVKINTKVR